MLRRLVPACLLAALCAAAATPPAAAAATAVEAERLTRPAGATLVRAGAGRAVRLDRPGALVWRTTLPASQAVVVRARGLRCAGSPRMTVTAAGATARPVAVGARWSDRRVALAVPAGRHTLRVAWRGDRRLRGRCDRALVLDRLAVEPAPPPAPPAPAPVVAPPPPPPAPPVDPLAPAGHRVGLGTAMGWSDFATDSALRQLFLAHFDSLTPENELKMEALQWTRGVFTFARADATVNFARDNGKTVRGHTLVWHQQLPRWVTQTTWTRDELRSALEVHVHRVVEHFRGRVDTWDVVNEPLGEDGWFRSDGASPWLPVIGPDYIEIALRAAREADPHAALFINEVAAEGAVPKLDALVALATHLKARGAPLDGIGLQLHTNTWGFPRAEALRATFARLAALGLKVEITEMDVGTAASADRSLEDRLALQADAYAAAGRACAAAVACTRITTWGMSDRDSWLGAGELALPFDEGLNPKPGWRALTAALGRG